MIVVLADSAETIVRNHVRTINDEIVNKILSFPPIGVVSAWGDRQGYKALARNKIPLQIKIEEAIKHGQMFTIEDLAEYVYELLRFDLEPQERPDDFEEFGFHVTGFAPDNSPRLYHIFWGCPRSNPHNEGEHYHFQPEHERAYDLLMLYNGRNELVDLQIQNFFAEVKRYSADASLFELDQAKLGQLVIDYSIKALQAQGALEEIGFPLKLVIINPNERITKYPTILGIQDTVTLEIGRIQTIRREVMPILGAQFFNVTPISTNLKVQSLTSQQNPTNFFSPGTLNLQSFLCPYHAIKWHGD